ncbi:MAG: hypothetical protein LAT76_02605 [Schleiferiaceae bacterium]|nr:hypothetical protein [Schleiferiaceae bacterium]
MKTKLLVLLLFFSTVGFAQFGIDYTLRFNQSTGNYEVFYRTVNISSNSVVGSGQLSFVFPDDLVPVSPTLTLNPNGNIQPPPNAGAQVVGNSRYVSYSFAGGTILDVSASPTETLLCSFSLGGVCVPGVRLYDNDAAVDGIGNVGPNNYSQTLSLGNAIDGPISIDNATGFTIYGGNPTCGTPPEANDVTLANIYQPRAGEFYTIPATSFSGTPSAPATIEDFIVKTFPVGASEIQIGPDTYNASNFPTTGVVISANIDGNPNLPLRIRPATLGGTVSFDFFVEDSDDLESVAPGTVDVQFIAAQWTGSSWLHTNGVPNGTDAPSAANEDFDLYIVCDSPTGDCDDDLAFTAAELTENAIVRDFYLGFNAIAEVIASCLTVEGSVFYLTDNGTFLVTQPSSNSSVRLVANSDSEYGQYLGPTLENVTMEMVMENGWHNIGFPVDATVADFASENNVPGQFPIVNISGSIATQNLLWFNSERSDGFEHGYRILDVDGVTSLYESHSYGTYELDMTDGGSSVDAQSRGFLYFLSPNFSPSNPSKLRVSGTAETKPYSYNAFKQWGGFNLIPNPFPVSIDVQKMDDDGFFTNNNLDRGVYIWDPNENRYFAIVPSGSLVPSVIIDGSLPSPLIAPFQSVYYRRTGASVNRRENWDVNNPYLPGTTPNPSAMIGAAVGPGEKIDLSLSNQANLSRTVTILPEYRSSCASVQHRKTNTTAENIVLAVQNKQNNEADVLQITLDFNASTSFVSGEDMLKMFNQKAGVPNFFATVDGRAVVDNRIPVPTNSTSVSIGLKAGAFGLFEISAPISPVQYNLFLEDKELGILHPFINGNYSFSNTSSNLVNRFVLHFGNSLSLDQIVMSQPAVYVGGNSDGITIDFVDIESEFADVEIVNLLGQVLFKSSEVSTRSSFTFLVENSTPRIWLINVRTKEIHSNFKIIR